MARRKVSEAEWSAKHVPLDTSLILKIDPLHTLWFEEHPTKLVKDVQAVARLSFVSLHPGPDISAERIDKLRDLFVRNGAAAVRVIPARVVSPLVKQAEAVEAQMSIREAVLHMLREVRTPNVAELKVLVEKTLSEVGL